jgi:DNA-binding NarL/FixJ family response regulator
MPYRIYVVDDHPMMRRGYAALIDGEPDLVLAGQAGNGEEAMLQIPEAKPDLVVADVFLGGMSGIELVRHIKTFLPRLPVLVISMHDEKLYADRALEAGAAGYLMKTSSDEEILTAMRRILAGHFHLSDEMEGRILHRLLAGPQESLPQSGLAQLSNRQLEVFQFIGHGLTTGEIAERLYISRKTVESHSSEIKKKLGLRSGTELMRQAVKWVEEV